MPSKRKAAVRDLSRAKRRGPPGPSPLVVLAGLPASAAQAAAGTINNDRGSRWRAIASPFANDDRAIYANPSATLDLGKLACRFAEEGRRDAQDVPSPSRIAVAFVEAQGCEILWDVFGHAVWPVPLRHPDWDYITGRHWRHQIEIVNGVVRRALDMVEGKESEELRLRLEARRPDDALLLPGRNFHLDDNRRLAERFRGYMEGVLTVADVEADIRVERFAFTRLEAFYRRAGGSGKRFAMDVRELVFAKSNNGQHGAKPTTADASHLQANELQRILEARYRFGTPLLPEGFQHDVQRDNNRQLNREAFDCVLKGRVPISGDHANVYPSDVVTGNVVG